MLKLRYYDFDSKLIVDIFSSSEKTLLRYKLMFIGVLNVLYLF